jgi:hypothetical protein
MTQSRRADRATEDISENKAGKGQKEPDPLPVAVSTRKEQKQVEERMAIGANVVYEAIRGR